MVAKVVVDVNNQMVDKLFDYIIPNELEYVSVGSRVIVNFNGRLVVGYVLEIIKDSDFSNLKSIIRVIDLIPVLNEEALYLIKYIKKQYHSSYLAAIGLLLPNNYKLSQKLIIKVINRTNLNYDLNKLLKKDEKILTKDLLPYLKLIKEDVNKGNLELELKAESKKLKTQTYYKYAKDVKTRSIKANELLIFLKESNKYISENEILTLGYNKSNLNLLLNKKAISLKKENILANPKILSLNKGELIPTLEQQKALDAINYKEYKTYLLYGITGSGKTLVYINAVKEVLSQGKEALVLVPEIALTTQIAAIFKEVFRDLVTIIHSKLTSQELITSYQKIKNKEVKIVLGARKAIFSPLNNLGLIIIDEEQEDTYCQENAPCYDARIIAQIRAKYHNIPLILGSATPRITSYYKTLNQEYELLKLTKRPNNKQLANVSLVDMRQELKNRNTTTISNYLKEKITETLKRNEQVILFYNKRGYASAVMCRDCGKIITCPNCNLPLTYHRNKNKLVCHLCNYQTANVDICPNCQSKRIRYVGLGTEKIISDLANTFKDARLYRIDSDSIGNDYNMFYELVSQHKVDIVVGTQMVTKGLDFENVTLVGVINADLGFFFPTYDANESNFAILEQVSGRSGRHKPGEVIIQTYNPDNFVIEAVKKHDYITFYQNEIVKRKLLDNPPFKNILKICLSSNNKDKVLAEANVLAKLLETLDVIILGPSEAVYFKVNNIYHYEIYLKYATIDLDKLNEILNTVTVYLKITYI